MYIGHLKIDVCLCFGSIYFKPWNATLRFNNYAIEQKIWIALKKKKKEKKNQQQQRLAYIQWHLYLAWQWIDLTGILFFLKKWSQMRNLGFTHVHPSTGITVWRNQWHLRIENIDVKLETQESGCVRSNGIRRQLSMAGGLYDQDMLLAKVWVQTSTEITYKASLCVKNNCHVTLLSNAFVSLKKQW